MIKLIINNKDTSRKMKRETEPQMNIFIVRLNCIMKYLPKTKLKCRSLEKLCTDCDVSRKLLFLSFYTSAS